jgi:putative N6-adenine-specific DNA methylase
LTENTELPEKKAYIAKTIAGLEEVLAAELQELGAEDVEILNRAVRFSGDIKLVYKANYCCRTALRILVPLFDFQLADEDDLYGHFNGFAWEEIMDVTSTLAIDAVVSESELTHSHYVALRAKDAIVDRFRERTNGRRPSVDVDDPDFRINIHIFGSTCDVSLDSSGASLHKRGYRVSNAEAPMSEVLAAGLILLSGWNKKSHFIDPMCGSGTLLIEAALIANNFPPGMYRKSFGFMRWKNFNSALWEEVKQEAHDLETEFEFQILGNDISAKNLGTARANVKSARLHKDIHLKHGPFSELMPPEGEPGVVVINPPYGERIKTSDIIGLYKEIGDNLKKHFAGYHAWVISSDHYALKSVGLKATRKLIVWNGPLECRFAGFDLYVGTKRLWIENEFENTEDGDANAADPSKNETEGDTSPKPRKPWADKPASGDSRTDRPYKRRDNNEERPSRPYSRDREDRPFRRERDNDKPFERKDRSSKPYQGNRDDKREDRPFRKERDNDRPNERDDRGARPFRRNSSENREDKPFRRERDHDKPFERKDRPFQRDRSESREEKPFRRERDHDKPFERKDRSFRKEGEGDKPYERKDRTAGPNPGNRRDNKEERPFRRERDNDKPYDRTDKPFRRNRDDEKPSGSRERSYERKDSPFKPYGKEDRAPRRDKDSDKPYARKDRTDKPFSRDKDNSRPGRFGDKPFGSRNDVPPNKEYKDIEVYQPQNRFSKPEKTYRRSEGKPNEGDPSGSKQKPKKQSRPRKPRNDED